MYMSTGLEISKELSLGDIISKTFSLYAKNLLRYFIPYLAVGAVIGIAETYLIGRDRKSVV